eukprot:TRINITY_DN9463_c0_g1_i2.p1 TRINITY_DN9463_c0_g1~~TRINITY_DN9463_c0_g1_i2.p1  ORF type:complete len:382 (+),score=93.94 TRINITY_DN9463_c0_g1_i2:44-1189(+)
MVQLSVKPPSGEAIIMEVELSMKVSDFRQAVADKVGDSKDSIRLVCSGHVLKDEKTLAEHNIAADAKIHLVRTGRRAAPAQAPAPSGNSLFSPSAPSSGSSASQGGPSRRLPPEMVRMLRQVQSQPQARMMFAALMQNPALIEQIAASNPALANNPETMAMLRDPSFLQQLADPQSLAQLMRPPPGEPFISRDVFQDTLQAMTSGNVPPQYPRVELRGHLSIFSVGMPGHQGPSGGGMHQPASGGAGARRARMVREIFSREAIQRAMSSVNTPSTGSAPASQPAAATSATATSSNPPAAPATQSEAGSGMETAADPTPEAATDPAGQQGAASGGGEDAPATVRYAAQLQQLSEMGFTDPVACVQALEACNGDVNAALQFLF